MTFRFPLRVWLVWFGFLLALTACGGDSSSNTSGLSRTETCASPVVRNIIAQDWASQTIASNSAFQQLLDQAALNVCAIGQIQQVQLDLCLKPPLPDELTNTVTVNLHWRLERITPSYEIVLEKTATDVLTDLSLTCGALNEGRWYRHSQNVVLSYPGGRSDWILWVSNPNITKTAYGYAWKFTLIGQSQ